MGDYLEDCEAVGYSDSYLDKPTNTIRTIFLQEKNFLNSLELVQYMVHVFETREM